MSTVTDHHNAVAGDIVTQIVKGTTDAGGDFKSIFVLLESVAAGVINVLVTEPGDEAAADLLAAGVKRSCKRLRDLQRLREAAPEGSA